MMLDHFVNAFATLFVAIDPIGTVPVYLALVASLPLGQQRTVALRATLIALAILLAFAFAGEPFLGFLGVSLPALQIAGGILLFLVALDMVFERRTARRQKTADAATADPEGEGLDWQSLAIFPLAIPLISGAGSMTSLVLLSAQAPVGSLGFVFTLLALLIVLGLGYGLMLLATSLGDRINAQVIKVLSRIMGVILAALCTQFIINGLHAAFAF